MLGLPSGTVTFLFTDIEGSTRLLQQIGDARYAQVLADHRHLLRDAFASRGGWEIETQGDGFLIAFQRARDAVLTALDAQRALAAFPWPEGAAVRVRMGLHTGEPLTVNGGYAGLDVHRVARICAAGWGGQTLLSAATAKMLELNLPEGISLQDLGEHRLKSLERPERIYQLLHLALTASFPPPRSLTSIPNNLPQQLTSFIGRERELSDVKQLLESARLVTLTGAGGCGKTRLALQVAADLADDYRDGVWLVELASVADAADVPSALASAVGLREEPARQLLAGHELPGRSLLDSVLDYLRSKQLLIVIDNCEHLIHACAHLVDTLLRGCPDLRILTTSQEPLGIGGERPWPVPPLAPPDPASLPAVRDLTLYPAVQLFMDRAAGALPGVSLTPENAWAVAQVCHKLDGIPLAIELAAARVNVLSIQQIAARLDNRFRLLTGGSRTALKRQQTLRATMDWSHGLLSATEKAVLRRLAVFVGGFTLEGAEAICSGDDVESSAVLDTLAHLVDKSLVVVDERERRMRYRTLETVRQYSLERLVESGELNRVRDLHRDRFLELAEESEPNLHGPAQAAWLESLDREHDNFRAALTWSHESHHVEAELRLVNALWWFWYVRGHLGEGRRWSESALTVASKAQPSLHAKAMQRAGLLSWAQGDYAGAIEWCEQSLRLAGEARDRVAVVYALITLGMVAHRQREYTRAAALYEEALAIARTENDRWIVAVVMLFLGRVVLHGEDYVRAEQLFRDGLAVSRELGDRWSSAYYLYQSGLAARRQGNYDQARALFEESVGRFEELGSKEGMKFSLNMLGRGAFAQGDYERAALRYEESLHLSQQIGDKPGVAYALFNLALAACRQGDRERGTALYRESLTLRSEAMDRRGMSESLAGLAGVAWAMGERTRAARLLGASDALRPNGPAAGAEQVLDDPDAAAVRAALTEASLAEAWAEGQAMAVDQAIGTAMIDNC